MSDAIAAVAVPAYTNSGPLRRTMLLAVAAANLPSASDAQKKAAETAIAAHATATAIQPGAKPVADKIRNALDAARKAVDTAYSYEEGLMSSSFLRMLGKVSGLAPVAATVRSVCMFADNAIDAIDGIADWMDPPTDGAAAPLLPQGVVTDQGTVASK